MANFYFQFRHTRPTSSDALIGEVVGILNEQEVSEPPGGHLSWVKVTGVPEHHTKESLGILLVHTLMGPATVDDAGIPVAPAITSDPVTTFDFNGLRGVEKSAFDTERQATLSFKKAVALMYSVDKDRPIVEADFD